MPHLALSRRAVLQLGGACLLAPAGRVAVAASAPIEGDGAVASFQVMHALTDAEGHFTYAPLIVGADGDLYGTLESGGLGHGTLIRLSPNGRLKVLHAFSAAEGGVPIGLTLGRDGHYYGVTSLGGEFGSGTFYRITAHGKLDVIYSFHTNIWNPRGPLTQGSDGHFYGVASGGNFGNGCVFRISTHGKFLLFHSFLVRYGADPWTPPVEGDDGYFYGTTTGGGRHGCGSVYRIHPHNGKAHVLHAFHRDGRDGKFPAAGLIKSGGIFYGTTLAGTSKHGAAYAIDRAGALTVLHQFEHQNTDGSSPWGVVMGRDGSLYGATTSGGKFNAGEIFRITLDGTLNRLHSFNPDEGDGGYPLTALVEVGDGEFYGVTQNGGAGGAGTVFRLRVK